MAALAEHLVDTTAGAGSITVAYAPISLQSRIVSGEEWDRTIAGFDQVCQEQLYTFAVSRWPKVKQEPILFLANGEIVGGALMMIQPLPLGVGAIAISKWAPMHKDGSRPDADGIHAGMVEALVAEYAQKRGQLLSVLPRASLTEINYDYERLIGRGFKRGSVLAFPNRYLVNLRLSDADQRKSFHQKWRYHLNKADKAGLTFEHATPDRLPEFAVLYNAMTDRKQFTDHSAYDTVSELTSIGIEALRPELFFVRHEGEIVAGALIFKAGERAVYLYGATNEKALPLRAGYFIQWNVIRWLRDNTTANWYDLGGTDGYQGLHQFKKGMVGDAGVIRPVPPVANYASNPLAYALGAGAFLARDTMNRWRRKISGALNPKKRSDQASGGNQP